MPSVFSECASVRYDQHGVAAPDAEAPVPDVDGTLEQLDAVVHALQAALEVRRTPDVKSESDPVQMELPDLEIGAPRA